MNSKEHRARLPLSHPVLLGRPQGERPVLPSQQQTMARGRDTLDDMTGSATAMPDSRTVEPRDATAKMGRWRLALLVVFGVLLIAVVTEAVVFLMLPNVGPNQAIGDHAVVMAAARSLLAGGPFYPAYETSGPFVVAGADILYPPVILPLLVAFSFVPDVLWWAVPIAITVAVFAYWRPSLVGWTLILLCLLNPFSFAIYAWGNPGMWFVALVALGTIYHWPSVFVLIKPTLAPFALVGIRHRSWWVALGVLVLVSLAFLPLWWQYLEVVRNSRGPFVSPLYSLPQVPMMLTPLIARWATVRRSRATTP